jgi:hypothetical protein
MKLWSNMRPTSMQGGLSSIFLGSQKGDNNKTQFYEC